MMGMWGSVWQGRQGKYRGVAHCGTVGTLPGGVKSAVTGQPVKRCLHKRTRHIGPDLSSLSMPTGAKWRALQVITHSSLGPETRYPSSPLLEDPPFSPSLTSTATTQLADLPTPRKPTDILSLASQSHPQSSLTERIFTRHQRRSE